MCPCSPTSGDSKNRSIRNNENSWNSSACQPLEWNCCCREGVGPQPWNLYWLWALLFFFLFLNSFVQQSSWAPAICQVLMHAMEKMNWLGVCSFLKNNFMEINIHAVHLIHLMYIVWWILAEIVLFHWCSTFCFPSRPFPSSISTKVIEMKIGGILNFFLLGVSQITNTKVTP